MGSSLSKQEIDPNRRSTMAILRIRPVSRRRFLASSAATTLLAIGGGLARPLVSRANDRPSASHGVQ
jgi:hypothetical protein